MIVDTHAHLYDKAFSKDIDLVITRAVEAGIGKIIIPGTKTEDACDIIGLCDKYKDICYPALAIHPEDMAENIDIQFELLRKEFDGNRCIAVGGAGIDLHYDKSRFEDQKKLLIRQLNLANKLNLPIILHCRDAFDEMFDIVKRNIHAGQTGVFHCFVGDEKQAQNIIDIGFYIGIGGVATFKNSNLKSVLSNIGLYNVVLETDCPYLAPVPNRGKRNEPSFLRNTVDFLSQQLDIQPEEIEIITTNNANRLFFEK